MFSKLPLRGCGILKTIVQASKLNLIKASKEISFAVFERIAIDIRIIAAVF